MNIYFITSNQGKVQTLQKAFELAGRGDIKVVAKDLNIIEPQLEGVSEVSKYKALSAFEQLNAPVLVEDGGFFIEALGGFPGVYARYVVDKLGVEGILKLMAGKDNREAYFDSCATFVDEYGKIHQFNRDKIAYDLATEIKDVNSPFAWSELWKIVYVREAQKLLCDFTKEDLDLYYQQIDGRGSLQKFANWFISKY